MAHGFGQRYELPLPLSLYLFGAASAVVVSFVIVALFVGHAPAARLYPRLDLSRRPLGTPLAGFMGALRLICLALFLLVVLAGFFGDQNPYRNIAPTMVWVIGWVGLAYVSVVFGNVWALINPWRTVFDAAEWLYDRLGGGRRLALCLPYPERLGVWPACVLLLAFSWIELVHPDPAMPANIARFAAIYSALTWAGMVLFGGATWLRHGEVFTVVFGTFARIAPVELREDIERAGAVEWTLRPPGAGLIDSGPGSPSMTALVLLLLSTVLYDGLLATPQWSDFESILGASLTGFGEHGVLVIRTIGLLAFFLVFLGAYVAVCALMSLVGQRSARELAQGFVLTLIPIAIGYHFAHYFVFLLIQGQYLIPLVSDPFGAGWNLLGTANYRPDIGIVGPRFAWYTAVAAILLGHVAAVYFAHVRAMRLFATRSAALKSQVPLTALMVVYTFVSLSILAEPIVERAAPPSTADTDAVMVPEDAVIPVPGDGRLQKVGPGTLAKTKLTYRLLGSAFHDGTRTTMADLLYSYMFAYRWGVRGGENQPHYDPTLDAATASLRGTLVGLRAGGTDASSRTLRVGDVSFVRELLAVDVYTTIAPENPEQDAAVAPPWSTLPWHLIVLMEEAVGRGWAAFSQGQAERRGVEWLDLVRSDRLKDRLASLVATFEREGYRPEPLKPLVSADEARKRWAALAAFHKARGHFLVTNGPYVLKRWSAESVALEAFRDLTYPLGVGSFDAYAIPRRGFITEVEQTDGQVRISGDIETVVKFQRSYRIAREPTPSVSSELLKRSEPECRYVVVNAEGGVVLQGTARPGDGSAFQVDIKGKLMPGTYTMHALIAVKGNVMNADVRRIPIVISSDR